jgi:hypothetical protein
MIGCPILRALCEGWDVNRPNGASRVARTFPKTGNPKNKSKESGVFFEVDLRLFSDHLSPAFHHDFTIKKPRSAPRFSQKPPAKHELHHARKKRKNLLYGSAPVVT